MPIPVDVDIFGNLFSHRIKHKEIKQVGDKPKIYLT